MGANSSIQRRLRKKAKSPSPLNSTYSSLMGYVHDNVIGDGVTFIGPYGKRAGKLSLKCSLKKYFHLDNKFTIVS